MRRIAKFESYQEIDDILDKISSYGISSLTTSEREFLDTYSEDEKESSEKEEKLIQIYNDAPKLFDDDFGLFKFEYHGLEKYQNEIYLTGVLYVPDLDLKDGRRLKGRLEGRIIIFENGQIEPEFNSIAKRTKHINFNIFDFCSGLEYELDSFIDDIVSDVKSKLD